MAILKSINVRGASRKKFLDAIKYISNPEKNRNFATNEVKQFTQATWVNRCLCGNKESKRQFKQFVVSMEMQWSTIPGKCMQYETSLQNVLHNCEIYFMEKGYIVKAWIHCNTSHPHFHLLLETCNAFTGKQFSQSRSDLAQFKDFLSTQLWRRG